MDTDAPRKDASPNTGVAVGTVLGGKYEILRVLGSGGFGAVYHARHTAIGRDVAVKVLRAELASNEQFAKRFLQEAQTANEVRHRNIVEVLDYGVDEGRPYLVMEYLRGEPLTAVIAREPRMAPGKIIVLLEPVLRALAAAHARGVVHRDIKPDNIFLVRDGDEPDEPPTPKLLDFGIAKRQVPHEARLTNTAATFGTPAYMAPEQVAGAKDVTAAADQYAFGAVLFEALAGRLPHTGDSYNEVIIAKATMDPVQLGVLRPALDPALVAVVMRALARKPGDRYPSLGALREALLPFQHIREMHDAPPPAPVAASPVAPTVVATKSASGASGAGAERPPTAVLSTQSGVSVDRPAPPRPAMRGTLALALGAPLLVAALAAGYRFTHAAPSQTTPATTTAPTTAASLTLAAPPAEVTVRVQVEPASARIAVDGVDRGQGHAELRLPRDERRHTLELSAPGYVAAREDFSAQSDWSVERTLADAAPATEGTDAAPRAEQSGRAAPSGHPSGGAGSAGRPGSRHYDRQLDLLHGAHGR